jgi:ABC-type sugar transport system substrate-binding protein
MADGTSSEKSEPAYKLSLEGNGITVAREVPESVARAIIALVMGGNPLSGGSAAPPIVGVVANSALSGGVAAQSVREYLDETDAKRNPDKIVAIAGYLKSQGTTSFSRDDVKQQFPKAGESIPGNYARDFALAVSTGWIAEHANTGTFYVTTKGEKAIENGFGDKIRRPGAKRKVRKNDVGDEA